LRRGREVKQLEGELRELVMVVAPALLTQPGIGPICAAQLLISWSHAGWFRSEAAFAMLAGAAPVQASSGQVVRHRLNRGGDRQLNRALHTIVMLRQVHHGPTRAYTSRRMPQAHRCPPALPTPGAHRHQLEDWKHQDPAGQPVEVVRRIRDDIDGRVRRLLAELVPTGA
jgi:hypothetical protein